MRHFRSVAVLIVSGLIAAFASLLLRAQPKPNPRDVSKLYGELCASCHGPKLTGAQAPSLLDDVWKFGGDDASLAKSIKEGNLAAGMPPMANALSEQEIRAMVIYIREEARQVRARAVHLRQARRRRRREERAARFQARDRRQRPRASCGASISCRTGACSLTEKPGQLRIVENGKLAARAGRRRARGVGEGAGRPARRRRASRLRDQRLDLPVLQRPGTRRVRDDRDRARQAEGRAVRRAADGLQGAGRLYRTGENHFGSRLVFDKGYLFFSIGERGQQDDAQDLTRPNGKVHRIFDDGRVPDDNPLVGQSRGAGDHLELRPPQPAGTGQGPVDRRCSTTPSTVPRGGDELNLVQKGRNYGWPVITYGMNYDGTPITDLTAKEGMEQPVNYWVPSIAVSSIAFYKGTKFPKWNGQLFLGALAQEELRRLVLADGKVTHQEVLFKGVGRVRDVVNGPDGLHLRDLRRRPRRAPGARAGRAIDGQPVVNHKDTRHGDARAFFGESFR